MTYILFHRIFITALCGRIVVATWRMRGRSLGKEASSPKPHSWQGAELELEPRVVLPSLSCFPERCPLCTLSCAPSALTQSCGLAVSTLTKRVLGACPGPAPLHSPHPPCPTFWDSLLSVSLRVGPDLCPSVCAIRRTREQSRDWGRVMHPRGSEAT